MAQKKRKTNSTNQRRKQQPKKKINIDLAVIALMIISVLLMVLIYTKSGAIGETLSPMLGGIMGWIKYIVPIGTFVIAIYLATDEKETVFSKIIQYIIVLVCIATIMTVFQINKGNLNIDDDFEDVINEAYYLGERNVGGGAIGACIAIPLSKMLGITGAVILSVGVGIILLVFMFNLQPAQLVKLLVQKHRENKKQQIEECEDDEEEIIPSNVVKMKQDKKIIEKKKMLKKNKKSIDIPLDEDDELPMEEQITINLNQEHDLAKNKVKESEPVMVASQIARQEEKINPNTIEANLFKTEEEKKEDKTKQVLQLEHTITVEEENYEFPPIQFLSQGDPRQLKGGKKYIAENATKLQKTLYSFGVSAKVENVSVGPAITRYELRPAEGVRVSKIAKLADDIALNLAAQSIRIEAPIPGKQAVGIEIPNKENEMVHLRDIIESDRFIDHESKLAFALGKDVAGEAIVTDIAKMPHVLIAGSTGSGKSVCINTLITSIIYKAKPSEVKLVMVDPKVVELSVYNGIPHLLIPVVTDSKKAAGALAWAVQEMENRYKLFAGKGVRDLKGYNEAIKNEEGAGVLPQIVIIIDELADLMMVAAKEVEDAICRLAQMARAAGMHLVIATQRPSVDVITGLIKANVPSRIAFAVSSQIDSRTILDMVGAEKLLEKGDMLFYPVGVSKPTRIQGAFVSDKEVEKIVDFLKSNGEVTYSEDIIEKIEKANNPEKEIKDVDEDDGTDPFLMDAIETVIDTKTASTSFIQRKFKVGYARAGRIIDQMEERGVISGYQGSKPREVLMTRERWEELKMSPMQEENLETNQGDN